MFPLAILPLPGELVPLHIFEPRYRQLLQEAEQSDAGFGIYCTHEVNRQKIGSWMKLESVLKRYPGGESDIVVKCQDIFTLHQLYRRFKDKMYPGGSVTFWQVDLYELPGARLAERFREYLVKRQITRHEGYFSIYSVAQLINLDIQERYRFLLLPAEQRSQFLLQHLNYQSSLLDAELKSKDVYQWN
jgi:Lon protease-like protein